MKINPKLFTRSVQKYDWDCGVAAVYFLLMSKGQTVDYSRLTKDLEASAENGTDLVKVAEFLKNRPEFEVEIKNESNLEWVENELSRGRFCLVAYQNWQGKKDVGEPDWGHYGVIYRFEGNKVYLFDPGEDDGQTEFTKEEFVKRWYEDDLGVHYLHWAMSLN